MKKVHSLFLTILITLVPSLPILSADSEKKVCFAESYPNKFRMGDSDYYFLTKGAVVYLKTLTEEKIQTIQDNSDLACVQQKIINISDSLLETTDLKYVDEEYFLTRDKLNTLFDSEKYKDEKKLHNIGKTAKEAWKTEVIVDINKEKNALISLTHAQYFDDEPITQEKTNNTNQSRGQQDTTQQNDNELLTQKEPNNTNQSGDQQDIAQQNDNKPLAQEESNRTDQNKDQQNKDSKDNKKRDNIPTDTNNKDKNSYSRVIIGLELAFVAIIGLLLYQKKAQSTKGQTQKKA